MNPELERRLRRYGATVDAAADAEETRRGATASSVGSTALADLDNVVALDHRPHHFYRVLAVAAAAVAVVAGSIAFAVGRSSPSTNIADRPITSTAPAVTEPSGSASTQPVEVAPPLTTSLPTTTNVSESSMAPPPTRPTAPPVCTSYTPSNAYHLDICDSGAAVRLVQERLRASIDSSLNVDGYFGPGTRNAVRTFQQMHGLTVDGQVGPATWALLVPDAPGIDVDGSGVVDPDEISTG
jgi:murein L,D-transpeptidase YcbB/YkuD